MNYAYLVCSDKYCLQANYTLKSLTKHCDCMVLMNVYNAPEDFQKEVGAWVKRPIVIYDIPSEEWLNKRMFCKIERLHKMPFQEGDNVFVLDTDLLIQDDIFRVFENDFDVCYTSRRDWNEFKINAGVWGFKYNDRTKKFLDFYVNQILEPTWPPYVHFRTKRYTKRTLDWWCDQDVLSVIYENNGKVPFDCKFVDIGYKYNFNPRFRYQEPETLLAAKKEMAMLIGDKEYKILHFKGQLKEVLEEI